MPKNTSSDARLAAGYLSENPVRRLVEESLLILGWVANWRPLEIFLYARGRCRAVLRPYAEREPQKPRAAAPRGSSLVKAASDCAWIPEARYP